MEAAAKARISDAYEIELLVPDSFPDDVPLARETGKRIRNDFHRLTRRLPLPRCAHAAETDPGLPPDTPWIRRTLRHPVPLQLLPPDQYGELPFGELAHGADGLLDDLGCLYGAPAAAVPGLFA